MKQHALTLALVAIACWAQGQPLASHTYPIDTEATDFADLAFLRQEIGDRRIVALGEQTHGDGATFEARSRLVQFLMQEMDFEVVLYESGMLDMHVANEKMHAEGSVEALKKGLYPFWKQGEHDPLFTYWQSRLDDGQPFTVGGFDAKHTSNYGFQNHRYTELITSLFQAGNPDRMTHQHYQEYIEIWRTIEEVWQKPSIKRVSYKMNRSEKARLRELSQWVCEELHQMDQPYWATLAHNLDEITIAYADVRIWKLLLNKKSIIPVNNRRDELMANNLAYQLATTYADKKVILIGATYHFIRNNHQISPMDVQGIPVHESTIMGDLTYDQFQDEIYTIGFTAYQGTYGQVDEGKKASPVVQPDKNSLEYALVTQEYTQAFVSLQNAPRNDFWAGEPTIRLFDYETNTKSSHWHKVLDGVYFIKTMTPVVRR
ncbi:MAG: erythromycin esterase family protein [Bacteroidota bacterium]